MTAYRANNVSALQLSLLLMYFYQEPLKKMEEKLDSSQVEACPFLTYDLVHS